MQSHYTRQFAGKALLLIWATFCILFFIIFPGRVDYVQWSNLADWQLIPAKLAKLNPLYDLANLLQALAKVTIFSVACISLGAFIGDKLKLRSISNSQTALTKLALLATEFLIGHGLFSLLFLTLAGLYQLTETYVILILFIGFLLGARSIKNGFLNTFTEVKLYCKEGLEKKRDTVIFLLSIIILLVSLFNSTARISYDATSIYFSDAKLTAMTDHIQFFLDGTFVASAFQTAIQYTALIQAFGDQAARMFSWICGLIVIIFSMALGERVGLSKKAIVILFALLLTSTAFLDLMGDGKVDLISSASAVATIYWIIVEAQNKAFSVSLLLLAGFLSGLAIVGRPFNAFLLGIFVILFYLQRAYMKNGFESLSYKRFASSMFWIGIGALGLGIHHLFANWLILGSPLAFLSSISSIDPANGPWDYNPDQILAVRLLYPIVATFYNSPQTLGNISPMFLAFLPALLIKDIRNEANFSKQLWVLFIISMVALILWIFSFFTVYEIRYVLFLWAILFIPLAEIIATVLANTDYFFQKILHVLIVMLLVFFVWRTIYISLDTYSPIDKQGNPQCDDSRFCEYLKSINKAASPGDRVLTLGAFRYYLRSDLFACSTRNTEYKTLQKLTSQNAKAFWEEVYRQGYKYIAYENDYTIRHLQFAIIPSPGNTPKWIKLEPIFGVPGDLQVAYKIYVSNPPVAIEATCQKNSPKGWEIRPPAP